MEAKKPVKKSGDSTKKATVSAKRPAAKSVRNGGKEEVSEGQTEKRQTERIQTAEGWNREQWRLKKGK